MVHLRPRQWLDTDEALVPIGPPPASEHVAGQDDAEPWAASDFWGEDAARVQDALHAPVEASGPEAPPEPERQSQPRLRRLNWTPALRAFRAHAPLWSRASAPRARPLIAVALAGSLAALLAFTASAALSGAPALRSPRNPRAASAAHSASFADAGKQLNSLVAMLTPARIPQLAQKRAHSAKSRPAKRRVHVAPPHTSYVSTTSPSTAPASTPTAAPSASTSAPAPTKPAGPSGPVSLLGAGTSPSG